MQVINAVWKAVFGDNRSADEIRAELLGLVVLHNTPGHYAMNFDKPSLFAAFTALGRDGPYGFLASKEQWNKTNGDYPGVGGGALPKIMPEHILRPYIEEYIITDGTVIDYARRHITSDGYEAPGFFDKFVDNDYVIVLFYPVHFEAKLDKDAHGTLFLTAPLNKTKDPYCVFVPAARINRIQPGKLGMEYDILLPDNETVREAYNKECTRVGRKHV
jgi:hypothetical protein